MRAYNACMLCLANWFQMDYISRQVHLCSCLPGAKGRLVKPLGGFGDLEVPPDYRYHRYYMLKCLVNADGTFKDDEGEIKAQTLEALGMYDYRKHKHTIISNCFAQPPGAK